MELYFVRHGQSENNETWLRTGTSNGRHQDPDLTHIGIKQAEHLAKFFHLGECYSPMGTDNCLDKNEIWITHLYTSLMIRSIKTGLSIAHACEIPLVGRIDIHESGGIYLQDEGSGEKVGLPGKNRLEFQQCFPDLCLPPEVSNQGWWNQPFEKPQEALQRAQKVLQSLLDTHSKSQDRVVMVSHGDFYNNFMLAVLGLTDRERINVHFAMNNAAVSRLDFSPEGIEIIYLNRHDFMPGDLIT
jgi:2,3-bisphosphoglycerate-dependent phosphoglycerate mutase